MHFTHWLIVHTLGKREVNSGRYDQTREYFVEEAAQPECNPSDECCYTKEHSDEDARGRRDSSVKAKDDRGEKANRVEAAGENGDTDDIARRIERQKGGQASETNHREAR